MRLRKLFGESLKILNGLLESKFGQSFFGGGAALFDKKTFTGQTFVLKLLS